MRIGLLGGSFNPPHAGHVLIAQQVLDFTQIEAVWFLPAFNHTFDKPLAPVVNRLAMTKLIKLPHTQVSTLEIDSRLDGNTINLLPILKNKHPQHQFTFLIGTDQLPTFNKWGNWQTLLKSIPFLVIPRANYPLKPWHVGMQSLTHPLFITTNISSSLVRARIKKSLSIDTLVTKEVKTYVKKHKLYR